MTKAEYMEYHRQVCEKMMEITKNKNADYTGASDDPFANLKMVEQFGAATTEAGIFTRMTDKFSRLASFLKRGVFEVKDETVEDTLLDMANYCILMAGYLKSKRPHPSQLAAAAQDARIAQINANAYIDLKNKGLIR